MGKRNLRLELAPWYAGLANDGLKCAHAQFSVVWDWNGDRGIGKLLLHHDMAATLTHFQESMARKDGAHLLPGKDKEFTQRQSPFG